ncbi:uncharacterized protein A1O5_02509 [Cladophialophora psammophila CBS 110553]|uniref:Uncharacterized protein n=1 Tax=Cladophialophora psammophila CBS 110553 TaxID=1182543 RepID=W9XVC4_9EURO|nr:uncharacterized protein A1O5_02509 [Cladophialophora psammophila CBS 110553]EXJ74214.1 hypothetical protein A1O5_02509 [Cladophialophora psammophila CBS 110553]
MQLAFYPPPFASPSVPFPYPDTVSRSGSAAPPDDERTKLLEKVSSVLPDINRLLHYYQESQGLLSEKDLLVKQAESQHNEEVTKLRIELSASKEEYERIIGEQARENVKLKSEIVEQTEKILLLEGKSQELAEANEEVANLKLKCESLESEVENSRSMNEQLTAEKDDLENQLQAVKDQFNDERAQYERSQTDLIRAHEKQMAEREDVHAKLVSEHRAGLSKLQLDLAGMITKHSQQRKDLDSARAIISEHEQSLAARAKELADSERSHKSELEARNQVVEEMAEQHKQAIAVLSQKLTQSIGRQKDELTALREGHQKEIGQLRKAAEGRLSETITRHKQREVQLQGELDALRSALEELKEDVEEHRDANDSLRTELATVQKAHQALQTTHEMTSKHHAELEETMVCLRDKQAQWQRESERMERIIRSLGQIRASKGKGDEFFVSAFNELALSVEEISKQLVHDQPYPDHALVQMAQLSGLPDITGMTAAARGLRSLLVQNQIFRVLQQRIFQPFLFTSLHEQCDRCNLETCLSRVSTMISVKSVHREAIWRAIAMRSLYTSPYGRKAASTIATSVSKEIVDKLQSMTLAKRLPVLTTAVRSIAKAAVELWRQVRIEWAAILSSMPPMLKMEGTSSSTDAMLWIRPHIFREGLRSVDDDVPDAGSPKRLPTARCTYLQGIALCHDSPIVLARRQEVMAGDGGRG